MTLQELNENYIYQSDKDKFGYTEVWEVIKPIDGTYKGDCESYMLTLLDMELIPKDTKLVYCKIDGVGHCIGVLDDMVIDCNCKKFMPIVDYANKYNMSDGRDYWKIEIWYKQIATKLFGRVPFVR